MTKVLLLQDVDYDKKKGEVINVRPGFARNYLFPRGYAIVATKQALKRQQELQKERQKQAAVDRQEAEAMAGQLNGVTFETHVKVDPEGHMYGSVSVLDIIHLVKAQTGVELERRVIVLKHAIKATGAHEIQLRLKEGVTAAIHVKIIPEEHPTVA